MTPLTALLPLEVLPTGGSRPALFARTLLLNQLIALPVALAMASVNGEFLLDLAIATLYSQSIGLLCVMASILTFSRLDALPPLKRLAVTGGQYFVAGVAGAEIARRVTAILFPWIQTGSVIASTAVGATVAVFVGVLLVGVRHLRARVVSTELEALQARINPHFLFNTLNSIAALIRDDPARAEAMTLQLSALFRYTLQAPRQGLVALEDEMTIVQGYLAIEQERLAARLTYTIEIDPALLAVRVPALVVQPIVENAIKHGVAESVAGGAVHVRGWREHDRVLLTVSNTGDGTVGAPGTGEGLDSVRRRLRATFGADATLTLTTANGTTEARLSFRSLPPSSQAGEARR